VLRWALISSFISGQRIQWFGHVMRRNEETIRAVLGWKPTENKPRGWSRKRWTYTVEEDLEKIGVRERKTLV